jgi:ABC-type phosphate/phosphonate transport system substrate-binding protein
MRKPLLVLSCLLLTACSPASAQQNRPRLKIAIYSSLLGSTNDKQVRATVRPMLDLVSARIGYPIDLELDKGKGREGLKALGKKLDEGTYHLAGVWGLDYGWLLQQYPNLQVMAVVANGERAPWRSQLMVRRQDLVTNLGKLKGKRLARVKQASLMDELFLDEMLRKAGQDPRGFFERQEPLPSVKEALLAVKDGQADCVMVNSTDFTRFQILQPGLARSLDPVQLSDPYPAPVLISRRQNLEKVQRGLWEQWQEVLLRIHTTEEGRGCVRLWRFEKLIPPDEQFLKEVETCARRFPMERLLSRQ